MERIEATILGFKIRPSAWRRLERVAAGLRVSGDAGIFATGVGAPALTARGRLFEATLKTHNPYPALDTQQARNQQLGLRPRNWRAPQPGCRWARRERPACGDAHARPGRREDFRQVGLIGFAVLNRRLLNYNMYADYAGDGSLRALLQRAQAEMARAVASN